jgi:hypothetical protein
MAGRNMTFIPGNEPGAYAGGFVNDRYIRELNARRLRMANYPAGDNVSVLFPWMRTIEFTLTPGEKRVLRRNDWQKSFVNDSSFPVFIDEVRFYAGLDRPVNPALSMQNDPNVKMSISHRKQILERFVPWQTLNTEMDRLILGRDDQMTWILPAPYFLSRTHVFLMDIMNETWLRWRDTQPTEAAFYVMLYGFGATDGEPIQLVKAVPFVPEAPVGVTNDFQTIAFDDDRDQPLRDAWITHIGFGGHIVHNSARQLQHTRIRPVPPEGPKWHGDEFYRICQLQEQIGLTANAGNQYIVGDAVIHRPIGPYVLKPGEEFAIEMWHRNMNTDNLTYTFAVNLNGTQEGHQ